MDLSDARNRVWHRLDHRALLRRPSNKPIDAIYIPTRNRPGLVTDLVGLLLALTGSVAIKIMPTDTRDVDLKGLEGLTDSQSRRYSILPLEIDKRIAELRQHEFVGLGVQVGDFVEKRNMALKDAVDNGYRKILILEDDIRGIDQVLLDRFALELDISSVVGSPLQGAADNSLVSRALRLYGRSDAVLKAFDRCVGLKGKVSRGVDIIHGRPNSYRAPELLRKGLTQGVFISGGLLAIDVPKFLTSKLQNSIDQQVPTLGGAFLPIYNDDWIAIVDAVRKCKAARINSLAYQLPHQGQVKPMLAGSEITAAMQEPGDFLAEYLYQLMDSNGGEYDYLKSHPVMIEAYKDVRTEMLKAIIAAAHGQKDHANAATIEAALDTLNAISVEMTADYIGRAVQTSVAFRRSLIETASPIFDDLDKSPLALHPAQFANTAQFGKQGFVDSTASISRQGHVGANAIVSAAVVLKGSEDTAWSVIEPLSTVGIGAKVEAGAVVCAGGRISKRVFMDTGSVVGNGGWVGAGTRLGQSALVLGTVHSSCEIGSFSLIDVGAEVASGVTVGAYCYVGAGFKLEAPLPARHVFVNGEVMPIGECRDPYVKYLWEVGFGNSYARSKAMNGITYNDDWFGTNLGFEASDLSYKLGRSVVLGAQFRPVTSGRQPTIDRPTYIGKDVKIGAETVVMGNVHMEDGVEIGRRSYIQCGAVLGEASFILPRYRTAGINGVGINCKVGSKSIIASPLPDYSTVGNETLIIGRISHWLNPVNPWDADQASGTGPKIGDGCLILGSVAGGLKIASGSVVGPSARAYGRDIGPNIIVVGDNRRFPLDEFLARSENNRVREIYLAPFGVRKRFAGVYNENLATELSSGPVLN